MANKLEDKITKEVLDDFEKFESSEKPIQEDNLYLKNIWSPILKIVIALIFVCLCIYVMNLKMKDNKNTYFSKIEGTWIDENNNNYEIYDNKIEINQGIKSKPFYVGEVTNILETNTGYKIVTKGNQITYEDTDELDKTVEKALNLSIEIKDYTEEFKEPMKVIIGKNELGMIRVQNNKEE